MDTIYLSVRYARKALLLPAREIGNVGSGQRMPTLPAIEATIPWDLGDVSPARSFDTLPAPTLFPSPTHPHE